MDVFGGNYDQYGRRITPVDRITPEEQAEFNRQALAAHEAERDPMRRKIFEVAQALGMNPQHAGMATVAANYVPYLGDGQDVSDMVTYARHGEYLNSLISGVAAAIPVIPASAMGAKAMGKNVAKKIAGGAKKKAAKKAAEKVIAKNMASLPGLRDMSIEEATRIASQNPHLIAKKGGGFIGAPPKIKNMRALKKQRGEMDVNLLRGIEGSNWYQRGRDYIGEVTSNPYEARWMSRVHGQYSPQASPESELGFALKDTNSALAYGKPIRAKTGATQRASIRAIEANDPELHAINMKRKTGPYAVQLDPASTEAMQKATAPGDFRQAQNVGWEGENGKSFSRALSPAEHQYMDYENAHQVYRANKEGFGGRTNWTGEEVQAAPWTAQKADDLLAQNYKDYRARAIAELQQRPGHNGGPLLDSEIDEVAWSYAFDDANKTLRDFGPKHRVHSTYEAQPFEHSLRQSKSGEMTSEQRRAFADDPRSSWIDENTGRDEIYAGYRLGDTGVAARVEPTRQTQGVYVNPTTGKTETNPGFTAGFLGSIHKDELGNRMLGEADRSLITAAEATRALVDMQGGGAAHKTFFPLKEEAKAFSRKTMGKKALPFDSFSLRKSQPGPMPREELLKLRKIFDRYGLPDVVDVNDSATATRFYPSPPPPMEDDVARSVIAEIDEALPGRFNKFNRAKVESVYVPYEDAWNTGIGSGAVTREYLKIMDSMPPRVSQMIDANPDIPKRALQRLERNRDWEKIAGVQAEDVNNLHRIIGEGPGFLGRLRQAVDSGAILPALAAVVLSGAVLEQQGDGL